MPVTPKYDLDTDNTLGGSNASDYVSSSQKAVKDYVDTGLSGKANVGLDNLNADGQMIIDSVDGKISNCILEIPQDINLTLSSGTLTLKSGSVCTKPDGTQTQLTQDKTVTSNTNGKHLVISWSLNTLALRKIENCFSGSTAPTGFSGTAIWYDTTNNIIKESSDGGSTWAGNLYFPFAIITVSNGVISSIDQVFNGACYVGHHAFVYPNVKVLIPNGLNDDGSLKSIEYTTNSLKIVELRTTPYSGTYPRNVVIDTNGNIDSVGYIKVNKISDVITQYSNYVRQYCYEDNQIYMYISNNLSHPKISGIISYDYDGTTVSNFTIRQPVRLATTEMLNTFTGADGTNAGAKGLVPPPAATDNDKFLKGDGTWATPSGGGGSSRNVGEIVQSTIPLTDAGLHLLDGALINGSGSYADFVTYIAGLVSDYPDLFTTEANWQSAVTTYGVCGKFVYDSVNNTVRLPKYSNKFWSGGGIANAKGNGKALGLTDGTNSGGLIRVPVNSNPIYGLAPNATALGANVGTAQSNNDQNGTGVIWGVVTSGESGLIADLSTITTALNGYWYIVIATSTKTEIEVDIDEVMTDLNGKSDVDLTNVNASGTSLSAGWAMPSTTYDELTLGASNTDYLAPANGYVFLQVSSTAAGQSISIYLRNEDNTANMARVTAVATASGQYPCATIAVKKGKYYRVGYDAAGSSKIFRFIYATGSESEA